MPGAPSWKEEATHAQQQLHGFPLPAKPASGWPSACTPPTPGPPCAPLPSSFLSYHRVTPSAGQGETSRSPAGRPGSGQGVHERPRPLPTLCGPGLWAAAVPALAAHLGDLGDHHLQGGGDPVGKMGAGPPLWPSKRLGQGPCWAGHWDEKPGPWMGSQTLPTEATALWGQPPHPLRPAPPMARPWEGCGQNVWGLDARQPLPPA